MVAEVALTGYKHFSVNLDYQMEPYTAANRQVRDFASSTGPTRAGWSTSATGSRRGLQGPF